MKAKLTKTHNTYTVGKLRPSSADVIRICDKKLKKGKTSKEIVTELNKKLKTVFRYDGRIGAYIIYKGNADRKPFYYVLTIYNSK